MSDFLTSLTAQLENPRKRKPVVTNKLHTAKLQKSISALSAVSSLMKKCDSSIDKPPIRTSAAPIPALSSKTQDLIDSIRGQMKKPAAVPCEDLLNTRPLKEIYGHLLDPQLPINYKRILTLFTHTDTAMNYAKHRKTITSFDNIKQNIEEVRHMNYDIEHLQMILHVNRDIYKLT